MTEWEPGPLYLYVDPDEEDGGTIARISFPSDGKDQPAAFVIVITNDRAQAERWRSAFAAGSRPNLKADPPIHYATNPKVLEERVASLSEEGDL